MDIPPTDRPSGLASRHTPHSRGQLALALALIAVAVVGAALFGLRLVGGNWPRQAGTLGPWLAAAGFMFGAGLTLLTVALSVRREAESHAPPLRRPAWLTPPAAAAMLVAGVSLAGALTYRLGHDLVARSVLFRLETAARLKESLLKGWIDEAHEDLGLWTGSATFTRLVQAWQADPAAAAPRTALLAHLWERALGSHLREISICRTACGEPLLAVVDPEGAVRRVRPAAAAPPPAGAAEPPPIHLQRPLDPAAPGLVVQVGIDPRHQLARLVGHWPGDGMSGELLLVQTDGDALTVIADEEAEGDPALRRIVANRPGLLATVAGRPEGLALAEGLSENGEPLLAWLTPVGGTRWLLLAKIDEAEAFGELNRVFGLAAALATAIALLGLWWSLQHRRYLAAAQGLLQERADQAQQLAALSRHVVSAQEEERRRLAADLHDQSGANLAAIQMNLKALERRLAPADADDRELFHETSALLAETVGQIRDFCADLRPASLDPAGLVEAIAGALARFARRTGAETSFDSAGYAVRQPAELEIVIFRLVQEALLNCAKHARARHVTVRLQSAAPGQVSLEVADDGIGFDPQAAQTPGDGLGQGLQLMQERARLVRGRLDVQSASGLGTRVRFERT